MLAVASVVTWFNWDIATSTSRSQWTRLNDLSLNDIVNSPVKIGKKSSTNASKWIVVTSIQYPTEDVKNLASQPGWTVVVVADKKTPPDWSHPRVHFLSVEEQSSMGQFAQLLPFASYTRKNLGYLYAMANGAEWIYDTDDDNKPYGKGLEQFDYRETVSGLRYTVKSQNISEKLFNPYQFFGYSKMWPRGFPLEHLRGHSNGGDRLILCRRMATAAVQQGIVHNDPDVDAIYRLLNADKSSGLHVTFNPLAPPIILDEGTYSPWNSQNTLFHKRAFFTMFLPTSVAFRVTDIWRSYFAQKLLHLIGEHVAFYPVNAVQFRNAHDYLKDFSQETDVYEKSGIMVEFLDKWDCSKETVDECTVELARAFMEQQFWEEEDYTLVQAWIEALKSLNYVFPPMKRATFHEEYRVNQTQRFANCHEANIDVGVGLYNPDSQEDISKASEAVEGFAEILDWCGYGDGMNDTFPPLPENFAPQLKTGTLQERQHQVLVMINNFPWSVAIGLIQRMYTPFFGMVIFCGHWQPEKFRNESLKVLQPVNYINVTSSEMASGRYYHYCMSKVRELRLQNVNGYWFVADDSIFNFWAETPVNRVVQPLPIAYQSKMYWHVQYGQKFLNKLNTTFKDDEQVQASWKEYNRRLKLIKNNDTLTGEEFMLTFTGKVCFDFFYLPIGELDYFADLIEVLVPAEMHVENAVTKILHTVDFDNRTDFESIWSWDRGTAFWPYYKAKLGFHPLKLSQMEKNLKQREKFCNIIVSNFVKNIFGQELSNVTTTTTTEKPK